MMNQMETEMGTEDIGVRNSKVQGVCVMFR